MARGGVGRVRPGHARGQITHDFPPGKAALNGRHVFLPQRAQDQAPGFEHRRRRQGWLGGRHVGSRFRFAGRTGPCAQPRPSWRGCGGIGLRSGDPRARPLPPPRGGSNPACKLGHSATWRRDSADPRQSKLCLVRALPLTGLSNVVAHACRYSPERSVPCSRTSTITRRDPTELDKTTPAAAKPGALTALAALTPKARSLWWRVQKRPQYVVDIFLRWLHAPGQERVVRRRPG